MTILVTGAHGHVGSIIRDQLLRAGVRVRATSRTMSAIPSEDGLEVVTGDLEDPATFPRLLDGVQKVFLYAHPRTAEEFVVRARAAGVEHIVVLSTAEVVQSEAEANPVIARVHRTVEEAVEAAGVTHTFVRPQYYATNTLRWESIRTDRELRTAFPDGTTAGVHERDIAEVAVHALLDMAPRSASHLVLGAGALSAREQVAAIAEALGEPVRVVELTESDYRAELLRHLPPAIADSFIASRGTVRTLDPDRGVDAVPALLGRPALTFAEWARDHVDDFR